MTRRLSFESSAFPVVSVNSCFFHSPVIPVTAALAKMFSPLVLSSEMVSGPVMFSPRA